jgi:uncharacterized protein YfaQ (DUF2300 family)
VRKLVLVALAAAVAGFGVAQVADVTLALKDAKPDQYEVLARQLLLEFDGFRRNAKGAPQVSQLADEATVPMTFMLVKQNAEIIRLLKKLANEP